MLLPFFEWLGALWPRVPFHDSVWVAPLLGTVHLLALAVFSSAVKSSPTVSLTPNGGSRPTGCRFGYETHALGLAARGESPAAYDRSAARG